MILGTENHLICSFLLMIGYFIKLLHPWKTPNNYSVILIVFRVVTAGAHKSHQAARARKYRDHEASEKESSALTKDCCRLI